MVKKLIELFLKHCNLVLNKIWKRVEKFTVLRNLVFDLHYYIFPFSLAFSLLFLFFTEAYMIGIMSCILWLILEYEIFFFLKKRFRDDGFLYVRKYDDVVKIILYGSEDYCECDQYNGYTCEMCRIRTKLSESNYTYKIEKKES